MMAAREGTTDRLSPVNFTADQKQDKHVTEDSTFEKEEYMNQILTGAQLSDARGFLNKNGEKVCLTPVIVDFRRLLQVKSSVDVIPGIPNNDLLHSVAALYNTSLSEMTPDVLYACLCDKQARTIILLRDSKDVVDEMNLTKKNTPDQPPATLKEDDTETERDDGDTETERADGEDIFTPSESSPGIYAGIFSDQDIPDDPESDDEDEDDEDFSKGIHSFIRTARRRRRHIKYRNEGVTSNEIGVEHRLAAALTFEKTYCNPGEKIIHLTLVAVRKKYRKWGIGKYLLSQVKDMSTVGQYEAVVVHADNTAVDFFQRYGFTDDILLNSRWSELAEQYTNCTLMSYLPPFTNHSLLGASLPEIDIMAMEKEITKWREKTHEAYRAEMSCVNRLRHEIIHLRALVSSQQDLITSLATENEKVRQEKFTIEKEFLEYRLTSTKTAFSADFSDDEDISADLLIKELEGEARAATARSKASRAGDYPEGQKYLLRDQGSSSEPYDHGKDTEDFFQVTQEFNAALKSDPDISTSYQVQMVTKAILTPSFSEGYKKKTENLNDSGLTARLYYCGSLEKPHRVPEILRKGFTEQDFSHGDYGRGLYFSKCPSKAAHFSALGMLLVAEVSLGCTETVVKKDKTRVQPSEYFDSIITPGRLCSSDKGDQTLCQEYVVFDVHQACPMYLITYTPEGTKPTPEPTKRPADQILHS